MERKAFKQILERYLRDACTPEERTLVEDWFARIGKEGARELSPGEEQRLFEDYERDLRQMLRQKPARTVLLPFNHLIRIAAAVIVIVAPLLFLVVGDHVELDRFARDGAEVKTVVNKERSALLVALDDGSEVILNPGSSLTYKSRFADHLREVTLEGEAFFEVAKDSLSPFVVKTGRLRTKVLGTSFTVRANQADQNIVVTVKSGRVSVQEAADDSTGNAGGEILLPNEQAIYNVAARSIQRTELETLPIPATTSTAHAERFSEASVTTILQAMERVYGTRIIFDPATFNECLLSTSVYPQERLFKRLDIICMAIGATYKVDGVSIVVSGKPCHTTDSLTTASHGTLN